MGKNTLHRRHRDFRGRVLLHASIGDLPGLDDDGEAAGPEDALADLELVAQGVDQLAGRVRGELDVRGVGDAQGLGPRLVGERVVDRQHDDLVDTLVQDQLVEVGDVARDVGHGAGGREGGGGAGDDHGLVLGEELVPLDGLWELAGVLLGVLWGEGDVLEGQVAGG